MQLLLAKNKKRSVNKLWVCFIYYFFYLIRAIGFLHRDCGKNFSSVCYCDYSFTYSSISPGSQSSSLQIASSVLNRKAFILPVLSIDKFTGVKPIFSASSLLRIFRFASITSRLIMIGIIKKLSPALPVITQHV